MGKIELQSIYEDICQLLDEVENDSIHLMSDPKGNS